jgi:hypothetical protein
VKSGLRLLLVVLFCACGDVTAPFPGAAVRFDPPSDYRQWWAEVEVCARREGDYRTIAWYRAAGPLIIRGVRYDAYWFEQGNRIYLTPYAEMSVGIIAHEMLHALLQRGEHPCEYFVRRCGSVIQPPNGCNETGGG